jgi:GNAT superfamily N-acetyltransferase
MIKEIDFPTIYEIWAKYLWPGREKIMPISNMHYMNIDNFMVPKEFKPTFIAYVLDNEIVGVNSGHANSNLYYRSRGLYVNPEHRKRGIGKELLLYTIELAKKENRSYCWSVPRRESIGAYIDAGFEKTSEYFKTDTSDHNCYVIKKI